MCHSCIVTSSPAQECYVESKCVFWCHFKQCQDVRGPLASHYSTSYSIKRTSIHYQDFLLSQGWHDMTLVLTSPPWLTMKFIMVTTGIRQSASQTMTLVQQLPLVTGDKIPEEVNHWKYFTLLYTIIKLSPRISYDTIAFLRILMMDNATLSKVELAWEKILWREGLLRYL